MDPVTEPRDHVCSFTKSEYERLINFLNAAGVVCGAAASTIDEGVWDIRKREWVVGAEFMEALRDAVLKMRSLVK